MGLLENDDEFWINPSSSDGTPTLYRFSDVR